jgi:hypothetical protein
VEHRALQRYIFSAYQFLFFLLCLQAISAGWQPISLPPYFCATIIQTKTLFIDLTAAVHPLHHHSRWSITIAAIGPPQLPLPLLDRRGACNMDYSQCFNKWGSWDLYSTIMSEIDGDLDDLLTIFHLLFGENRCLKKIKF